jgi:hypothetical protein
LITYIPDLDEEGADPDAAWLLGRCTDLRKHALADGLELTDTVESLGLLDGVLARWRTDGESRPWLAIEVGLYLGTVLVHHAGAAWETQDDGRPIVVVGDYGVDVVDFAHDCVTGEVTLTETYAHITA